MKRSNIALAMTFSISALFLSACNDDKDSNQRDNQKDKSFVSETSYTYESEGLGDLSAASSIKVMNYKMPNVLGKTVETSALVFFPKIAKPKDGYRVVVWAHGTLGGADKCAPTNTPLNPNFKNYTAKSLLEQGYVIVAPDYEGLGGAGEHPYLHIPSEARSAQYAVKAAKEHYGQLLQGSWMSVGQSQGGQASLGIAEYANNDVTFKGAVAGAPASSLDKIILEVAPQAIDQLPQPTAIETYATLLSYAALTGVGITSYEPTFNYQRMFGSTKAKEIATLAKTECLGEIIEAYKLDIQSYVANNPTAKVSEYHGIDEVEFKNDATIQKFLTDYSQPTTKKLDKPILIVQGVYDTNVPYVITQGMYQAMYNAGTDVKIIPIDIVPSAENPVVNGSHTGAILAANESGELVQFIKQNMPAQ
ncbi:MAG: prolyl oligopeptidase family serine peptidase [Acinetobacter sp.]|nr:prolyl oligopeptidase family serine peptidase [Acinetobacter sp.]